MQIRPLCGHYTRVNTPLVGAKYWRESCTFNLTWPGKVNAVLLSLPYQINSLPGHVRLLVQQGQCNKHCKYKLESKQCSGGLDGMHYF